MGSAIEFSVHVEQPFQECANCRAIEGCIKRTKRAVESNAKQALPDIVKSALIEITCQNSYLGDLKVNPLVKMTLYGDNFELPPNFRNDQSIICPAIVNEAKMEKNKRNKIK